MRIPCHKLFHIHEAIFPECVSGLFVETGTWIAARNRRRAGRAVRWTDRNERSTDLEERSADLEERSRDRMEGATKPKERSADPEERSAIPEEQSTDTHRRRQNRKKLSTHA